MRRLRFSIRTLMIVTLLVAAVVWVFLVPELKASQVKRHIQQGDYSELYLEFSGLGLTRNVRFVGTSRTMSELLTSRRRLTFSFEQYVGGSMSEIWISRNGTIDIRFNRINQIKSPFVEINFGK